MSAAHSRRASLDAIFDPKSFLARVGVVFERLEGLSFDDEGQSCGA